MAAFFISKMISVAQKQRFILGWLPVGCISDLRPPKAGRKTGRIQASNYVLAALGDLQTTGFDEIKQ
jgi:hypothetical protein